MARIHHWLAALSLALGGATAAGNSVHPSQQQAGPWGPTRPVAFVANAGQWPDDVAFVARRARASTVATQNGWWTVLPRGGGREDGWALRIGWDSAVCSHGPLGERVLGARFHFFQGADAATGVAGFGAVRYPQVFPGIDIVVGGARSSESLFEFDLELAPGADLDVVELVCQGAERLSVDARGRLVVHTPVGEVLYDRPLTWQWGPDGNPHWVDCTFRILGRNRFGFEANLDPRWGTVIDPALLWSTFLGGGLDQVVYDVAVGPGGEIIAVGGTESFDFPTTPGAFDPSANGGGSDGFVTCFTPAGDQLLWSTYFGGSGRDEVKAVALGPSGVTIAGDTNSLDFPTVAGSFQTTPGGLFDAFVARLTPAGDGLVFSSYLGGSQNERGNAVALVSADEVVVGGTTASSNFPTTVGAFDTSYNGGIAGGDAFLTRFDASGAALVYSTFLGSTGDEGVQSLAARPDGAVTAVGATTSQTFPTSPSAFSKFRRGALDGFVSTLDPQGSFLPASTYLGGFGLEEARSVAVDANGAVTVAGWTDSNDFPTTPGVVGPFLAGAGDGFLARLQPALDGLEASTYLGGTEEDGAHAVVVAADGRPVVAGETASDDFPVTPGAFDPSWNGTQSGIPDGFVARLSQDFSALDYASYFGGEEGDRILALRENVAAGYFVMAGRTSSPAFPTTEGVWQPFYGLADGHGFVSQLALLVNPIPFGTGKTNSTGLESELLWDGFPSVADQDFELWVSSPIVSNQFGFVVTGSGPASIPFQGGQLLVAPPLRRAFGFQLDFVGFVVVEVPLDPAMIGSTLFFQAWFTDPMDPLGVGLTNAVEVFIHP